MDSIPIVDFSSLSLTKDDISYNSDGANEVASQIKHAFSTIGFVYLKNFGISDTEVNSYR